MDSGSTSGFAPMVPDSYIRTTPGACVRRARFAAADGMPIPTKHTVPFFRRRAASMVMISLGVYSMFVSATDSPLIPGDAASRRNDAHRSQESFVVFGAEHVLLHPREERVAVARDRVPGLAE